MRIFGGSVTSQLKFADAPSDLRKRADRLRDVVRGVMDPAAHHEIERFIAELEERAEAWDGHHASPTQHIGKLEM